MMTQKPSPSLSSLLITHNRTRDRECLCLLAPLRRDRVRVDGRSQLRAQEVLLLPGAAAVAGGGGIMNASHADNAI